jgi:acetylornithine deacetylase/succinyl-diaminopimelate desuccinylase-like protein
VTELRAGRGGAAVPSEASARLNFRLVPHQDPEQVAEAVTRRLRASAGATPIHVQVAGVASPVLVTTADPIVRAARQALTETWQRPPVEIRSGGTIPVVATLWSRHHTVPAMWGLSRPEHRIHSTGEWFALRSLRRGVEVMTRFLEHAG